MKRVSIFGCGRLGLAIGRELIQAGHQVTGSTTTKEKFSTLKQAGIEPALIHVGQSLSGDISSLFDTDVLIVSLPPSRNQSAEGGSYTYLRQLECIGDMAAEFGVQQVIFTGATFIYPLSNGEVCEDDVDPDKSSFMGLDWLKVEQVITAQAPERTTVLRLVGLMGEGHNAGAYFSGRSMAGADAPVNMIHQSDVAGVVRELIAKNICGQTLNVSAPEHPTKKEFYTLACNKAGIKPPLFTDQETPYRIVNCNRLARLTNYSFKYPDPLKAL